MIEWDGAHYVSEIPFPYEDEFFKSHINQVLSISKFKNME